MSQRIVLKREAISVVADDGSVLTHYSVVDLDDDWLCRVTFDKEGTTPEALLTIVRDHLEHKPNASDEETIALDHVREAISWLNYKPERVDE